MSSRRPSGRARCPLFNLRPSTASTPGAFGLSVSCTCATAVPVQKSWVLRTWTLLGPYRSLETPQIHILPACPPIQRRKIQPGRRAHPPSPSPSCLSLSLPFSLFSRRSVVSLHPIPGGQRPPPPKPTNHTIIATPSALSPIAFRPSAPSPSTSLQLSIPCSSPTPLPPSTTTQFPPHRRLPRALDRVPRLLGSPPVTPTSVGRPTPSASAPRGGPSRWLILQTLEALSPFSPLPLHLGHESKRQHGRHERHGRSSRWRSHAHDE